MNLTRELIEETVKDRGYAWFENGDYNLNIVGVRNSDTGDEVLTNLMIKLHYPIR